LKKSVLLASILLNLAPALHGASYYTQRLDDPKAVYLAREDFSAHADGIADDSAALQAAIDKVQQSSGEGILFIPEGRYRITRTIYVWPGVRVIGYGKTRPVMVLTANTPSYQQGIGYMFFFAGGRPGSGRMRRGGEDPATRPSTPGTVPPNNTIPDANPGTFYSAMSNIDFEIGEGNAAAVGIRFHIAQHCFLTHMDFHTGSGLAALNDIGNEAEDLHFYGGDYGILTGKPSPGWQFTLLDSTFEGQRKAAIREHEAGLTLIHDSFKNVPAAIDIDANYADELWVRDASFENISGPAITISNEHNFRTEINLESIACNNVATFALLRESGQTMRAPGPVYVVKSFSHGLAFRAPGAHGEIATAFEASAAATLPAVAPNAIIHAPPLDTWANLRSLGAKGDGISDDTAAIQKAIDTQKTIYVPMGRYVVSDTLHLRPDTVLIGLHPSASQFDLLDRTPAFQGPGAPKALLEAPAGGHTIVSGIGLSTGGINPRAVGALWMAGPDSLMDDVRFLGGHGTNGPDGKRMNPYNETHTADPDFHRQWDAQYPSLWIANGGGGTFADIWTPSTFAQAGLYISNTKTPGHVYELSSEHHVRNEIKLDHVSNWELDALQTEEERGESGFALPLSIVGSENITIANMHSYRVVSSYQPFPNAVTVSDSHNIRIRNFHMDSDSKAAFDNAVVDTSLHADVREREFANLDIPGAPQADRADFDHPALPTGAKLKQLASGFFNISGAAVDNNGQLYFVDAHWQRIYRWAEATHEAQIVRDTPLTPVNLIFDKAGDLLVVAYNGNGTVYTFKPGERETELTLLEPHPASLRPGLTALRAPDVWGTGDLLQGLSAPRPYQYVSPDQSVFLPTGSDFVKGELYYGTKMADVLRAFSLAKAPVGKPFYVSDESEERTYRASVDAGGSLTGIQLFVERGGESVAQDAQGNVYIAAGEVFVYDPQGKLIDTIDVPERPTDLIFGGKDGHTLFVFTHSALYAVQTRNAGL
jgi:sugar lactone lactonase YvrE